MKREAKEKIMYFLTTSSLWILVFVVGILLGSVIMGMIK